MKKLINLIALVMLVSVNVLTPFTYAWDEIVENETENIWEVAEISEDDTETSEYEENSPENITDDSWEVEQDLQVEDEQESDPLEYQDDENTSNISVDSTYITESELENESKNQDEEESEESLELEKNQESITISVVPNASVTLLSWTWFNSIIKTLANNWVEVPYTWVDNNIQSFHRVDVEPVWVTTWEISIAWSEYPVHAWFSWWILYYTTKAEIIQLNENSQQMFYNCSELIDLDLSNFNTSNVTNMNGIFAGCSKLEEINLSWWNFSQYNNSSLMMNMTYWSPLSLKYLNMKNTKYWTSMNYAFGWLTKLEEILLDWVDTSEVNGMYKLFYGLDKIKELDLSSFDTSNVTDMWGMFEYCTNLEAIYVNTWFVTDQVTSSSSMFYGDTNLIWWNGIRYNSSITDKTFARIDKSWQQGYFTDLGNITVKFIFWDAKNEVQNVQYGWHPRKPSNQQDWLPQIKQWVTKDGEVFDFDKSKITKYTELYAKFDTEYATLLPWRDFNMTVKKLSWQTGINSEYWNNTGIVQILQRTWNMPSWVTTAVVSEPYSDNDIVAWYDNWIIYYYTEANKIYLNSGSNNMFVNFNNLINIDMTNWDTSKVKTMEKMFFQCASITWLDLWGWDTSNVTSMYDIFRWSNNLRELNLSWWNFTKYCSSLNLSMWLTSNIKKLNMTNTVYSWIMNEFFYSLWGLQELILDGVDTSNVTSMAKMFSFNNFTWLDLSSFDTSNVTNMFQMFMGCSKLEELNMSWWDFTHYSWGDSYGSIGSHLYARWSDAPIKKLNLTNVKFWKSLSWAFANSNYLEEIILDWVDTSNVTDMTRTFYWCPKLTELDLSSFDTSNVKTMEWMFMDSYNLKNLDLSNFNTSKVKDTSYMFFNCSGLETLDLSNWDTSSVTNMFNMFYWCKSLINLDLSNFNTSNATNIGNMFNWCNSLKNLNVSNRDTSNVSSSLWGIFQWCSNLETLKMDWWDFRTIWIPSWMLGWTTSLKYISMSGWKIPENFTNWLSRSWGWWNSPIEEIDVTNWDLSQTRDAQWLFADSRSLKTIKWLDTWNTSEILNMSQIFQNCTNLTWLDLSSWDTSRVTNISNMFSNCSKLTTLDLSNFDTSNVTNMSSMFAGSTNLEYLNLSGWDFTHLFYGFGMWTLAWWQTLLKYLNLSNAKFTWNISYGFNYVKIWEVNLNWADVSNVTNMTSLFAGNDTLTKIGLEWWDTSNVGYMWYMFLNCSGLTELDLSSFDTSNVKNMSSMFYNTPNLETIYASEKFVVLVPEETRLSSQYMFSWTTSVVWWNGTKFDPNFVDKTYALIDKVWQTGYFTDKNAITVKFINTLDWSETTSTFVKWQKLTPPTVNGYHVVWWYLDEAMTQQINLNNWVDSYSEIYVKYERNGSSGGWWWGGGWGWSSSNNTGNIASQTWSQVNSNTGSITSWTNEKEPEITTWSNVEIQTWSQVDPQEQVPENDVSSWANTKDLVTPMDYDKSTSEWQSYSTEFQQAYEFAKWNWITTMPTIQKANMEWKLTRIAMAKMLSQYAMNVLWQKPANVVVPKFNDVTDKQNSDYDDGVTLAYQLGIMWQNMPWNNFRPNDEVTRAEFATALSRMAYWTSDWEYKATSKYYIHHMEKLVKEWIITKDDPNMKELRGYVMIMLMRSAK